MPNLILDLMVDRVDLVDEGANSAAFIKLYKRKENEQAMTLDEILAKMKPEHAEVIKSEISKAKEEVPAETEAELNDLKTKNEEMTEEVAKAKKDLEEVKVAKSKDKEPDFEEVMKNLDPSVQEVFKSLKAQKDAAETVARAAAEEKLTTEAVAKAKELKSLPIEEAKLVEVMKGISPEVHEILKAANKAIEDGGLFEEVGKSKPNAGEGASSAWEKIEKKAAEIETEKKVTKAKAITMAIQENPDLYREYLKGGAN